MARSLLKLWPCGVLAMLAGAGCWPFGGGGTSGAKPEEPPVVIEVSGARPPDLAPGGAKPDERFGPEPSRLSEPYRIRTDDVLEIGVWGEDDMTRRVRVGPDGCISYFRVTELRAAGLSLRELQRELARNDNLGKYYRETPEVFVNLVDSAGNFVSVTGVVRYPGLYKISNETRLADVIAKAGGIPLGSSALGERNWEVADLSQASVLRGDQFLDVEFSTLFGPRIDPREMAANNVLMRPNDRIFIPSAVSLDNKVFVVGEVRNPRVIRYSKEISFLEALLEAGDVPVTAKERGAFIVRGRFKKPEIIAVNAKAVRTGDKPDVALKPGDVVYVPKTALAKTVDVVRQLDVIFSGVADAERAYMVRFDRQP